ncbi:MAG: PIN domain-containing protein [Candidatus Nanohalobium sp.]
MTKTVIDTNVLISLLNPNDENNKKAEELLGKLNQQGGLFIDQIVYTELAAYLNSKEKLDNFIEKTGIKLEKINRQASYLAAQKYSNYLEDKDEEFQCPKCGNKNRIECSGCGNNLNRRQHVSPDFMVGSHAEEQADQLATFDSGFHREYFAELKIVPEK